MPLELAELSRRFLQWTYLPILPTREETLRACIREGIASDLWAVAIGDNSTMKYQKLIEKPDELEMFTELFDGSASLVRGELLELIRHELGRGVAPGPRPKPPVPPDGGDGGRGGDDGPGGGKPPGIPPPAKRFARVRLRLGDLRIAKTSNLQPYLFKVLQDQDAGAELALTIDVNTSTGISEEILEQRIVEGLEQLGIAIEWEAG
jgi:hypothetical protein